jgi:N-acetylglucosaminyl-diphospho-decaprenol L-rhamnosyltransferase
MLMPRSLFQQIGGFDEAFFLHAEDLDLCRRVRDAGRRVAVANHVPVTHVQGTSSRSRPFFVLWHKHRSLWRYFAKHEGVRAWTPRGLVLLAMLGARLVLLGLKRLLRPR